jgi:hypothetical protein
MAKFVKGQMPWNKGIACADETKAKISAKNKGRKHTPETEAKVTQNLLAHGKATRFVKGQVPHNKGTTCPRYTKEEIKEHQKEWRQENKNKINAVSQKWRKENPEAVKAMRKRAREKNAGRVNSANAKRHAEKLKRTPSWLTKDDLWLIKEASDLETHYLSGQNTINSRNDFNAQIIKQVEPIFDAYPQLTKLPVFAWGRYYKYECAGDGFEVYYDENGFSGFKHILRFKKDVQWDLLGEIDETHNVKGGKLWIGEWDIYVDREDAVKWYNFDDRGGMCLIVVKDCDNYCVECVDCDSPE